MRATGTAATPPTMGTVHGVDHDENPETELPVGTEDERAADRSNPAPSGVGPSRRARPRAPWVALVAVGALAAVVGWVIVEMPGVDRLRADRTTTTTTVPATTTPGDPAGPRPATTPSVGTPVRVSEACTEAAAPLRTLAASTPSGLTLTDEESSMFNEALTAVREACTSEEVSELLDRELSGWMNAATTPNAYESQPDSGGQRSTGG